jgi:predicted Holliday junction resolvase-like endonuclease
LSQQDVLDKLIADKRLYGECPSCGETFPLFKSHLFYRKPTATPALNAVEQWRRKIIEAQNDLTKRKQQTRQRSERGVIDVNVGKVLEKIAPALPGFRFDCHDCRPLFEPVDYIIFEGLTKRGIVESIQIIDIKTGQSGLNPHQQQIKNAVDEKRVEWNTYQKPV